MLRAMFLCCLRICICLSLELVGSWVVLGFSVGMEAFDELLSINVPWSQEFSAIYIYIYISVRSAPSVSATSGLLLLMACVLSQSILLRL